MRPTRERASVPPGSGIPASLALPDDGLRRPANRRRSVVFPAPFGPNTARHSVGANENVTPATAFLDPNARASSDTSTIGVPVEEVGGGAGGFVRFCERGFIRLELATLARAAQKAISLRLALA